jgi:hypothetical protein
MFWRFDANSDGQGFSVARIVDLSTLVDFHRTVYIFRRCRFKPSSSNSSLDSDLPSVPLYASDYYTELQCLSPDATVVYKLYNIVAIVYLNWCWIVRVCLLLISRLSVRMRGYSQDRCHYGSVPSYSSTSSSCDSVAVQSQAPDLLLGKSIQTLHYLAADSMVRCSLLCLA